MTTVIWNNYTIRLFCDRNQWVAVCKRDSYTREYRRHDLVWLNGNNKPASAELAAFLEAQVRKLQSRADSASVRRIDGLYTRDGRRVSLATGRPPLRHRKQPPGTFRDDRP